MATLLQRPGQVVTREELWQLIWPNESFGDFDHAINLAVAKLRAALGDSADVPHLIETLPRRGYRFIAPFETPTTSTKVSEVPTVAVLPPVAESAPAFAFGKKLALLFLVLGVLALGLVVLSLNRRTILPTVVDSVQITKDELQKGEFTLRLLSDGLRLYFTESLPEGTALMQVSTQGGEPVRIPVTLEDPKLYDISPIRSELLVAGGAFKGQGAERPLWIVPLPAGPPHRVGDILAHDACWTPDGQHMVFVNDRDLFIAKPDGSVSKLASAAGFATGIRFSPDGTRLRFTVHGG